MSTRRILDIVKDFLWKPDCPKKSDAIRIGLIGASKIAPMAIINSSKSHAEVFIAAVAARDEERARVYAKKYGIPIVHKSYQELLDDPAIDAVYIALPNGLHYEWATKALRAGKHVLLEKPSTSNATEAIALFRNEVLKQPKAPVVLEAIHTSFHPAWQTYLSLLDPANITYAYSSFTIPANFLPLDDIRFQYELAGGALMDLGAYNIYYLRSMMAAEPAECLEATSRRLPEAWDQNIDHASRVKWRFPNGAVAEAVMDLGMRGGYWFPWLTKSWPSMSLPRCYAVHRETIIPDPALKDGQEYSTVRKVTMLNHIGPHLWHRIDIETIHTIRDRIDKKRIFRTWRETESKMAYVWPDGRAAAVGKESWPTYRWMLEEFVNRIRGREGSGVWVDGKDSIKQMAMIDSAYEKSVLPLRPTSTFE